MKKWTAGGSSFTAALLAAGLIAVAPATVDAAARVEEVVSPGGIRAYLTNEPSIPFLSMSVFFEGGAASDPDGKEGGPT